MCHWTAASTAVWRGWRRWDGGWRLEGLPWTYKMDTALMYKPDVDKMADGANGAALKVAVK